MGVVVPTNLQIAYFLGLCEPCFKNDCAMREARSICQCLSSGGQGLEALLLQECHNSLVTQFRSILVASPHVRI